MKTVDKQVAPKFIRKQLDMRVCLWFWTELYSTVDKVNEETAATFIKI